MAEAVGEAMTEFGHDRYVVSAGDVGCDAAGALAARPERVTAPHVPDERLTKPHTLAVGLDDSPAGRTA